MIHRRAARLVAAVVLLAAAGCSTAQRSTPGPSATVTATPSRTPSTSSAQVVIEQADIGILAVRDLAATIADGHDDDAWALLGPRTREAVGSPDDLGTLGLALAPLVGERAPFDDVIVSATADRATSLVVLGDGDTPDPIAASVTTGGDRTTIELSPPAPSRVRFTVRDRRRIEITTPPAADVELVVDGFHFHPSLATDDTPATMTIPYPLSPRRHLLGAWYRTVDGAVGVGTSVVAADDG